MEDVRVLGLRGDLLQLYFEGLADAYGKHPDTRLGGLLGRLQYIILAPAVGDQDGHPLNALGAGAGAVVLHEDVLGGVADGVAGHRVPADVADVGGGSLHLVQALVSPQVKLQRGPVAVAHHGHARLVRAHVEGLHQVGHPLPDLLKVLLPHAGRRVQDEGQVVVDVFTPCVGILEIRSESNIANGFKDSRTYIIMKVL